ncbi:hypothetical protein D1J60_25110 [Streptomyces sp. W1SF4]|nr:hypothetical protein D1J60_25110 [Streptomyces sp. W1SF4]
MVPETGDPLPPSSRAARFRHVSALGNEKTPRGCERSARGSEARWPLPRRSSTVSAVTEDRRAAVHNHELSRHARSVSHGPSPVDAGLSMRAPGVRQPGRRRREPQDTA